jgi:hypothetical protein
MVSNFKTLRNLALNRYTLVASGLIVLSIIYIILIVIASNILGDLNADARNVGLDPSYALAAVYFMIVIMCILKFFSSSSVEDMSAQKIIQTKIRTSYFSSIIIGCICVSIGVATVVFTQQTVNVAGGRSSFSEALSTALVTQTRVFEQDALNSIDMKQALRMAPAVVRTSPEETPALGAASSEAYAVGFSSIKDFGSSVLSISDAYARLIETEGTNDKIEYRFASELFVRLGAISVLLLFFGVTLRHAIQGLKRAEETRNLLISLKLESEGVDTSKLAKIRAATQISETVDRVRKSDNEIVYQDRTISSIFGFLDRLSPTKQ